MYICGQMGRTTCVRNFGSEGIIFLWHWGWVSFQIAKKIIPPPVVDPNENENEQTYETHMSHIHIHSYYESSNIYLGILKWALIHRTAISLPLDSVVKIGTLDSLYMPGQPRHKASYNYLHWIWWRAHTSPCQILLPSPLGFNNIIMH